jgi:prephenate dehydrogenase
MEKVAIVGFGRFGRTLYRLLKDDFEIIVVTRKNPSDIAKTKTVFYCVPISAFETVIKTHRHFFKDDHLLIDVLSVKIHPANVLKKYLQGLKTQALLTHPMFGPDSSKDGFAGLPIVINRFMASWDNYQFWKNFFVKKGLRVIELTPQQHDRLAAFSQGVTHFIGRILQRMKFSPTPIDTLGARKLNEVMEQTCNDTWQLFKDLQQYNPYTKKMRLNFGRAYDKIYALLLPKRVNRKYLVFGIQGGRGSFNEEAILSYIEKNKIKNFKIKYLYTTEKVLKNLHQGNIDFGLFAVVNSTGGIVEESIRAMTRYHFQLVESFPLLICHCLMKRKDVLLKEIKKIIAHPQNFRQCKNNLEKKFPHLLQISGKGDLVDTARCAKALAEGKIDKNTAILGPKILSTIYNFDVIEEDLQDNKNNLTTFFLVKRASV